MVISEKGKVRIIKKIKQFKESLKLVCVVRAPNFGQNVGVCWYSFNWAKREFPFRILRGFLLDDGTGDCKPPSGWIFWGGHLIIGTGAICFCCNIKLKWSGGRGEIRKLIVGK